MTKRKKGGRYTPPKAKQAGRPPWLPRHWRYDPAAMPSREQMVAQLDEHEAAGRRAGPCPILPAIPCERAA